MSIDESFKRPGAIPFKWEIQPGVPKPHHQTPSPPPVLPSKLSPPPSKLTSSTSQFSSLFLRSASASPSKRQQLPSKRSISPSPLGGEELQNLSGGGISAVVVENEAHNSIVVVGSL